MTTMRKKRMRMRKRGMNNSNPMTQVKGNRIERNMVKPKTRML